MPFLDWDAFQDAHYRPHLVVAILDAIPDAASGKSTVALFERLAAALGMWGNYAVKQDGASIRAAFEIDTDAERFAGVLRAKTTFAEPEWASKSLGRVDSAGRGRIAAALRQKLAAPARRRERRRSSSADRSVVAFPDEETNGLVPRLRKS
jgi:hypothetical protein